MVALIQFLINLIGLIFVFLIPYNVDRPMNRIPYVTFGLIAVNVFVFFATVFYANICLPADRFYGQKAIDTVIQKYGDTNQKDLLKPDTPPGGATPAAGGLTATPAAEKPEGSEDTTPGNAVEPQFFSKDWMKWQVAMGLAFKHADTDQGFTQFWQLQHAYSTYVMTPHYSVLNTFAYRPGDKSFWRKILGLFGSMFLHAGLDHILGNMIFLFAFGRALEDAFGPRIYLGSYVLCGIAASLLFHIMTMQFTPGSAMIPSMGASGAIAGVMGVFVVRFYRTLVRVAYLTVVALIRFVFFVIGYSFVLAHLSGDRYLAFYAAIPLALASVIGVARLRAQYSHRYSWGVLRIRSVVAISFWVLIENVWPAMRDLFLADPNTKTGGVAHWAHIGGFAFGLLYAMLIQSQEEGKVEYMLEDAQKAYNKGEMDLALDCALSLITNEPQNPAAYEVMAKAYDELNQEDPALDNYEIAIQQYCTALERGKAATLYLFALQKHPRFIMPANQQLALGNQMARDGDYENAANTLVKIPYTYPESPECEIALLRCSQLYLQHLNQPQVALQLLDYFMQRYPDSQYLSQAERGIRVAQYQLNPPVEGETQDVPVTYEPEAPAGPPGQPATKERVQAVIPEGLGDGVVGGGGPGGTPYGGK